MGYWKYSKIRLWWWLHNTVNIRKFTEFYTLKSWILWYVKSTSIKLLHKKEGVTFSNYFSQRAPWLLCKFAHSLPRVFRDRLCWLNRKVCLHIHDSLKLNNLKAVFKWFFPKWFIFTNAEKWLTTFEWQFFSLKCEQWNMPSLLLGIPEVCVYVVNGSLMELNPQKTAFLWDPSLNSIPGS